MLWCFKLQVGTDQHTETIQTLCGLWLPQYFISCLILTPNQLFCKHIAYHHISWYVLMLSLENEHILYAIIGHNSFQVGKTLLVQHISELFLAFLSNLQTIIHTEIHEKQHLLCSYLANTSTLHFIELFLESERILNVICIYGCSAGQHPLCKYRQSHNSNLYGLSYVFCSGNCRERKNNT